MLVCVCGLPFPLGFYGLFSRRTCDDESYIELYDPEQRDEQKVKGDEEAEGPPHVGDALLLAGFVRADARSHGRTVDRPRPPAVQPRFCAAAASAVHPGVGPAH